MPKDRTPLIIGLVAKKGAGKSTAARVLMREYGFFRRPFAQPLKSMLSALGVPWDILDGDDAAKMRPMDCLNGRTVRHAAQTLGTEWGRLCLGHDFWVQTWLNGNPSFLDIVADDCRFPNEAEAVRRLGGTLVRIDRDACDVTDAHTSETAMDAIECDHTISNHGSVTEFESSVRGLISELIEAAHAQDRMGLRGDGLSGLPRVQVSVA